MFRYKVIMTFFSVILILGCSGSADDSKIQKVVDTTTTDEERIKATIETIDSIIEDNIVKVQKIHNHPHWWNHKEETFSKIDASMKEFGFDKYNLKGINIYQPLGVPIYTWIKISEDGESIIVGECKNEGSDIHLKGTLFRKTIAYGEHRGEKTKVKIPLRQLTRTYEDEIPLSGMVARHSGDVDEVESMHPINCSRSKNSNTRNKEVETKEERVDGLNLSKDEMSSVILAYEFSSFASMEIDGCGCAYGGSPESEQAKVLEVGRKQEGGPSDSGYWPVRVRLQGTCPVNIDPDFNCETNRFKGIFEYIIYKNPYGEWKSQPTKTIKNLGTRRVKKDRSSEEKSSKKLEGEKYRDTRYRRIEHGDHYHYFPPNREKDIPLSRFPSQPPEPGEKITPTGKVVTSTPDS